MKLRKPVVGILVCAAVSVAACSSSDSQGTATGGSGGSSATGGSGGGSTLPQLTVNGNKLQDPSGKTIVLRGSSLIDIGMLQANLGGVNTRLDAIAAAGVQGHVVRMPVYPEICYNGKSPSCSPLPYPVGTGPTVSGCTAKSPVTAATYVSQVLKPAVDYATSKNLYVIIDFHQIDNATSGSSASSSATDANTFWTD